MARQSADRDEQWLRDQGAEIAHVNDSLVRDGQKLRVLRSIELNLNPVGEGDMQPYALAVRLGHVSFFLTPERGQIERYLWALRNRDMQILGHPVAVCTITAQAFAPIGAVFSQLAANSTRQSRSMPTPIARTLNLESCGREMLVAAYRF